MKNQFISSSVDGITGAKKSQEALIVEPPIEIANEDVESLLQLTFEELKINPDRFCEGISKIGYRPSSAIMDIVDNSIAAGADEITIEMFIKIGSTGQSRSGVAAFKITDNGSGMNSKQLSEALAIGSDFDYPENSLSKFGFGLKSAGFSLGRQISVTSKTENDKIYCSIVDRDVIKSRGKYGVCQALANPVNEEFLARQIHGSIVDIRNTPSRQESANRIRNDLNDKLGVTYYKFLIRTEKPLRILIKIGERIDSVKPHDILFREIAKDDFNPDSYDCLNPCLVLDTTVADESLPVGIEISVVVFPQDQMQRYGGFTEDQKRQVDRYQISKSNCGFFFYRNDRLIRWGDRLDIAAREDLGFRAIISFNTVHDEFLHVDVSKQHLELSEQFLRRLTTLCTVPLGKARKAFEICKSKFKIAGKEGHTFNEQTASFEDADIVVDGERVAPEKKARILDELVEETILREKQDRDATPDGDAGPVESTAAESSEVFERVRYTARFMGLDLSEPGVDRIEGTYVRVNKNHPFYEYVLNGLEDSAPARLALEALFWCGAVAEVKTRESLPKISDDDMKVVFDRYRKVFSQVMDAWISGKSDLFE